MDWSNGLKWTRCDSKIFCIFAHIILSKEDKTSEHGHGYKKRRILSVIEIDHSV